LLPNGLVLVAGCFSAANILGAANESFLFDRRTNTCADIASPLGDRFNHTATLLNNGRVLLCGGQSAIAGSVVTAQCMAYDPAANTFTDAGAAGAADMSVARTGHTATLLYNGLVLIAGGYNTAGLAAVTTELYNPLIDAMLPGPAMIERRAYPPAVAMGNRNVLITGGANKRDVRGNKGFLDTSDIYNPVSNTMMPPPPPMLARRVLNPVN
jgi:hypothetical protein